MVFDVEMEDLRRKARMVAGGHMTDVPLTIMYASFLSCETGIIDQTMVVLNGMSVKTDGIMNAYIKAPWGENVYTILGTEFEPDEWKMAIIA